MNVSGPSMLIFNTEALREPIWCSRTRTEAFAQEAGCSFLLLLFWLVSHHTVIAMLIWLEHRQYTHLFLLVRRGWRMVTNEARDVAGSGL